MPVLYAQTSGSLSTNASAIYALPGLALELPEGDAVTASVTLNLPSPYAEGNDFPGADHRPFGERLNLARGGELHLQRAKAHAFNRMPTTLVVGIPLTLNAQKVVAVWYGVRGSTVKLDSPATLSAVI